MQTNGEQAQLPLLGRTAHKPKSRIRLLALRILDRRLANFAIEGERGLIEIVERNRRIEISADIERRIGREVKRHGCWNAATAIG